MFLGLVEMTFGLVYASFSFPEWQALKMTFFAPCVPWCRTKKLSLLIKTTTTTIRAWLPYILVFLSTTSPTLSLNKIMLHKNKVHEINNAQLKLWRVL